LRLGDQDLLEARLRAPHPFGLPLTAEASTLYRYRDVASYRERRLTGQAALIKPLLNPLSCRLCPEVTGRLTYELTEAYLWDKSDDNNPTTLAVGTGSSTIARVIPKVTVSRRDSPIDPRRGAALDAAFEVAHPALAGNLGERAQAFMRVLVGAQGFVPLGKPVRLPIRRGWVLGGPLILAMASSVNMALPYGRRAGVPTSETFGYGGDLSVRGLRNRASTVQLDDAHFMFTASAELRWYVLEHLGPGDVQLAAFIDSGTVAAHAAELYQEHTLSLGPALRYVTPFGPVSVAYGKAVLLPQALWRAPHEAPRRGRVHLTFGYAF
jgi:outer membrane protein assembly factor BamA